MAAFFLSPATTTIESHSVGVDKEGCPALWLPVCEIGSDFPGGF